MVKSKKKVKVIKKSFDIEAGFRQFGVLVEHMDSKISLNGLKRKVDIEEFSALEHRVAMLEKSR